MRSIRFIFILLFITTATSLTIARTFNIVPQPQQITERNGNFKLTDNTHIVYDAGSAELKALAQLLADKISFSTGKNIAINEDGPAAHFSKMIFLTLKSNDKPGIKEAYTLNVSRKRIILSASAGNGIFYGIQSLFQLMPPQIEEKEGITGVIKIPAVLIRDEPRYIYRGLHLDVCRHMFPVSFIKKYIDIMAMYKMNTFHWHLTEDQGWRIEIKKYPLLTEIGSMRKGSQFHRGKVDSIPYGGFYTQKEAREIVEYAAKRYITVIPEIEMPGHSVAALTAYPQLSCTGGPFEVRTTWGIAEDIYCAGNDQVFNFLQDVLDEIMDIFPSTYIHIGGDEAPKTRWKNCPLCQQRIKNEGLKDEQQLQSYFIQRIEKYLVSKGHKLIGWDEILEGGLAPEATVMSWRGEGGGIAAAKQLHDVIMTPGDPCYLDHYQADPATEPFAIGGYTPLKDTYGYNPTPDVLSAEEGKHILGAQGNVWTEFIATPEHVEYMAFPRAIALAEVTWSPKEKRNYDNFLNRMKDQFQRLDLLGVNACKKALTGEDLKK